MKSKILYYSSIIFAVLAIATILIMSTGCGNRQILDFDNTFKYAIIEGIGEIEITSWRDYAESDMIQVSAKDGTVYLTHSNKVILKSK